MAITDELRHNIEGAEQLYGRECPRLRAIADRIDEKHRKAMDDSYRDGYQEGKRDGDDEWYEEHESYLEEHGWYQALDADKQPVKFGDEVEWRNPCGSCELRHGIVTGIKTDYVDGEQVHEIIVNVDGFTVRLMPTILHHYHAPEPDTWERIIRDAVMRGADIQWRAEGGGRMTDYFVPEGYDLVDRCKALAGDES